MWYLLAVVVEEEEAVVRAFIRSTELYGDFMGIFIEEAAKYECRGTLYEPIVRAYSPFFTTVSTINYAWS